MFAFILNELAINTVDDLGDFCEILYFTLVVLDISNVKS